MKECKVENNSKILLIGSRETDIEGAKKVPSAEEMDAHTAGEG